MDNKSFYDMFLEPEMHVWTGNDIPDNELETLEQLRKYRDLDGLISWTIIDNDTKEFMGTYWIAPTEVNGKKIVTAEALRIGKPFWEMGYKRI